MNKSQKSMFDVLEFCHLAQLPEPHDQKSVWITAIGRTRKRDGNEYFCYMERNKDGQPRIVRDFGAVSAIVETVEVYPILYLEASYLRRFKKDDEGTARLVEYLKENGVVMDFENADRKVLDKMNIAIAIQKQLADAKKKSKLIIKD